MGLLILPFLLFALIVSVIAFLRSLLLFRSKQIGIKEVFLGLGVSLALFGLICLSYLIEGSAWVLSPAFRIPVFMVFIPFVVHLITKRSAHATMRYFSSLLLISIALTGILGLIFHHWIFDLIDFLGLSKIY